MSSGARPGRGPDLHGITRPSRRRRSTERADGRQTRQDASGGRQSRTRLRLDVRRDELLDLVQVARRSGTTSLPTSASRSPCSPACCSGSASRLPWSWRAHSFSERTRSSRSTGYRCSPAFLASDAAPASTRPVPRRRASSRVVLVDADLLRPGLAASLGVEGGDGLRRVLLEESSVSEALVDVPGGGDRLRLLGARDGDDELVDRLQPDRIAHLVDAGGARRRDRLRRPASFTQGRRHADARRRG